MSLGTTGNAGQKTALNSFLGAGLMSKIPSPGVSKNGVSKNGATKNGAASTGPSAKDSDVRSLDPSRQKGTDSRLPSKVAPGSDPKASTLTGKTKPPADGKSSGTGKTKPPADGKDVKTGQQKFASPFGLWDDPDSIKEPGWGTLGEADGKSLINAQNLSPSDLLSQSPDSLYSPRNLLIAHRGLVDNFKGIPENSIAAVKNAFNAGINNVELDVQATSDGIAVPLHDDSTSRMLGPEAPKSVHGAKDVKDCTFKELGGKSLYIFNPPFHEIEQEWSKTDQTVMSLDDMLKQSLAANPHATIFLDPKSFPGALAAARTVMNNPALKGHVVMKTSNFYWGGDAADKLWAQATTPEQKANLSAMMVMPVLYEQKIAGGMGSQAAVADAYDNITSWSRHFQIPSTELYANWDPAWGTLKSKLTSLLSDNSALGGTLSHNPVVPTGGSAKRETPVVSATYRMPDFTIDGVPYVGQMDGHFTVDQKDPALYTVGAEKNANGWLTTDVPLQEAQAIGQDAKFSPGNKYVDLG